MKNDALAAIDRLIAYHQSELTKLQKAKGILAEIEAMPEPTKAKAPAARKHAPRGAFRKAILSLYKNGEELSNADMRERLKKSGYAYPFDAFHLRKTAAKMAKSGDLQAVHRGDHVFYKLS